MKKKFHQSLTSWRGMTLVEVAVSVGILSAAMLASVQIRQSSFKLAKVNTVNSQITEEHRMIANLVSTIPKIRSHTLIGCTHPDTRARFTSAGGVECCKADTPGGCGIALGAAVSDVAWEELTQAFWSFVGPSESGDALSTLSVDNFNTQVSPALVTAGCTGCHTTANLFDNTQKWGLGSPMGRVLLESSISFAGTLPEQDLRHFITFDPEKYDLATGEIVAEPNKQCRALVASTVTRTVNGCVTTINACPGGVVPGSSGCRCSRMCRSCNASGKNCYDYCCAYATTFRCMESAVSQAAATCTAPLVVRNYQAYRNVTASDSFSAACGGVGIRTVWECQPDGQEVIKLISKWTVPFTVTTSWTNENDGFPRSMVTRGELK